MSGAGSGCGSSSWSQTQQLSLSDSDNGGASGAPVLAPPPVSPMPLSFKAAPVQVEPSQSYDDPEQQLLDNLTAAVKQAKAISPDCHEDELNRVRTELATAARLFLRSGMQLPIRFESIRKLRGFVRAPSSRSEPLPPPLLLLPSAAGQVLAVRTVPLTAQASLTPGPGEGLAAIQRLLNEPGDDPLGAFHPTLYRHVWKARVVPSAPLSFVQSVPAVSFPALLRALQLFDQSGSLLAEDCRLAITEWEHCVPSSQLLSEDEAREQLQSGRRGDIYYGVQLHYVDVR